MFVEKKKREHLNSKEDDRKVCQEFTNLFLKSLPWKSRKKNLKLRHNKELTELNQNFWKHYVYKKYQFKSQIFRVFFYEF